MQTSQSDQADTQDALPDYTPVTPESEDDFDESAAAASEIAPDTHPVFGTDSQPQEVVDREVLGTKGDINPLKGENTVVNYDPESDVRIQEPPPEED